MKTGCLDRGPRLITQKAERGLAGDPVHVGMRYRCTVPAQTEGGGGGGG